MKKTNAIQEKPWKDLCANTKRKKCFSKACSVSLNSVFARRKHFQNMLLVLRQETIRGCTSGSAQWACREERIFKDVAYERSISITIIIKRAQDLHSPCPSHDVCQPA
jgi:hypothetical protein